MGTNQRMALVPFAASAAVFCFAAVALWHLAKRIKFSQTETEFGKALHVESPVGTLDMHPEAKVDARLAPIPVYPGALPENPDAAESVIELDIGSTTLKEISASYWTVQSAERVWDFYRQQLPDWQENHHQVRSGRELIRQETDYVLLVRVSRRDDLTVIDTSVELAGYPRLFERR
jgi:hypothetical protein